MLQPANGQVAPMSVHQAAMVARETQVVQGKIISAKHYPRDQGQALKRIESACQRVKLAEQAMYSYSRGGQEITGPSIRLAEVLAQNWGNLEFGFREIERRNGESVVLAYCWDLETNVTRALDFIVPHVRETKKGSYTITSERDIYEMIANQAQRRVRSSILAVMPGDIVEAAIEACEKTLNSVEDLAARRSAIVKSFHELEISVDAIERRIGKKVSALSMTDFVQLKKIYNSLRDGMSKPEDWFEQIHEPEKIKRTQSDGGTALPTAADKKNSEADKRVAVKAFKDAFANLMEVSRTNPKMRGVNPDDIIKAPCDEHEQWSADRLFAAADILTAWVSKNQ